MEIIVIMTMRDKIFQPYVILAIALGLSIPVHSTAQNEYPLHSLLATGSWYKIPISTTGIYKITTKDLPALSGIHFSSVALYGAQGGMLASSNQSTAPNDLTPAAIQIIDNNADGIFGNDDYILFYGEAPSIWRYNASSLRFEYHMHAYANNNFYFLTLTSDTDASSDNTLRIQLHDLPYSGQHEISTHTAVDMIHNDNTNVHNGGQIWIDSKFTYANNQRVFNFTFPTTDNNILARYGLASSSSSPSTFTVSTNASTTEPYIHRLSSGEVYNTFTSSFNHSTSNSFSLTFTYNSQESNAAGYFDFIELNGTQRLSHTGGQSFYRNGTTYTDNPSCRFLLSGSHSNTKIWDVTVPEQPLLISIKTLDNGNPYFVSLADQPRTFIEFADADALPIPSIAPVDNQDIHGTSVPDYVIVTHRDYINQANSLADLHHQMQGLNVLVVTQEQVFNEFSSGRPDPMAIRRMLRCMRSKNSNNSDPSPRYLLLFGKGTFDNRDILGAHQTTVITYQTTASFGDEGIIYPSDDIYGHLDSAAIGVFEGSFSLGIGRLPAKNTSEADLMVDKITRYMSRSDMSDPNIRGDWRNYVTLLADDADPSSPYDSVFTSDSENTARSIKALYPHFNIDRIYADSYIQQSGADGSYYPDVNNALRQRINYGTLLLNYIGHGSSGYIGTERYMEISDIDKYSNNDRLTFFVTSTCSFGRYDQLQDICGAEAFLLADAAGVGTIAAARPIHHTQAFNSRLCLSALNPENSVGDALRMSKNATGASHSITLIGDPALHLSIPRNEVVVTHINNHPVDPSVTDSVEVLSRVTVEGEIHNPDGNIIDDFNGTIYPIVFDREVKSHTLANDNDSTEVNFYQQKNILYKGRENVTQGRFSYSFIIPRDVSYRYDYAKLSHYATTNDDNATGQYGNIMFGGFNNDIIITEVHPTVRLFINDTNFRNGGITNETPTIYAILSDSIGINSASCGLGHDITAVIDNNPYSTVTLNDFFEPDINDSRNGTIRYTLGKLDEGYHTLTLKCWNIFNYSGYSTISFRVANDRTAQIGQFVAAPNPAHDFTTLRVEHNLPGSIASATINIYDIQGRHIRQFTLTPNDGSYNLTQSWDFTTDDGILLPRGIYIARTILTTHDGQTLQQNTKIIRN